MGPSWLPKLLRPLYVLAMLLGLVVALGGPVHHSLTRHANILRVLPGNQVEIGGPHIHGLVEGQELPIYRFNPEWKRPIGHAHVLRVAGERAVLEYDPASFHWPMGRQGVVLEQSGTQLTLDGGSAMGFATGMNLRLFRERELVASARIESVSATQAKARVLGTASDASLVGAVGSEFIIPTQAAWFAGGIYTWIEWLVIALTLGLWAWSVASPVPGDAVRAAVASVASGLRRLDSPPARMFLYVLLGFPLSWLCGRLSWYALTHLLWVLRTWLPSIGVQPFWSFPHFSEEYVPAAQVLWFIGWMVIVLFQRRFPLAVLWEALSYRVPQWPDKVPFLTRGQVNWVLHIAIFYAFASTLTGFLQGNLNAMAHAGWRGGGLKFTTLPDAAYGLGYMVTNLPDVAALDDVAHIVNLGLFSACIVGCLIGYGHTMLSILWKDGIKNVDFTILGWATNAICYGPLLGLIIWRMMPPLHGEDPIVTQGPWLPLMLVTAMFLNLLYTLSIWNMGPKFGVMVDKGMVDWGFYGVVRHPSYTLEAMMFVALEMVGFTGPGQWAACLVFFGQYWLRSEREDHFMGVSNPDYAPYRDTVPDRYLPGLY